jgi:hypothetical protein
LPALPAAGWKPAIRWTMREAHVEHFRLNDRADIHAVLLSDRRIARAPKVGVRVLDDAAVAIVAAQRVAAGGDEIVGTIELRAR